eukprot:10099658-Prorocentrum_lima.AAC.1
MARQSKRSCPRSPRRARLHTLGGPCCHFAVMAKTFASLIVVKVGTVKECHPARPTVTLALCDVQGP